MTYRFSSYELCALAVLAFIIDHAGLMFFPADPWFRAFRLFGLVWFFPAGYNSAWRSGRRVWIGLLLVVLLDAIVIHRVFPVCALATLLIARRLADPVMVVALKSRGHFWGVQLLLTLLIVPSNWALEYGALALMIALLGWLVRHRDRLPPNIVSLPCYFVFVTALYLAYTQYLFNFSGWLCGFVVISTALAAGLLYNFNAVIREDLSRLRQRPDRVRKISRFVAHNSLEIYVLHLIAFRLLQAYAAWPAHYG